jgi:hypothetical protein
MSEISMGRIAFEATCQYIASNVPDDIPEVANGWEDLPPAYREAWEVGAQAVLTERERIFTETMVANRSGEREPRDMPFNLRSMGLHHPLGEER